MGVLRVWSGSGLRESVIWVAPGAYVVCWGWCRVGVWLPGGGGARWSSAVARYGWRGWLGGEWGDSRLVGLLSILGPRPLILCGFVAWLKAALARGNGLVRRGVGVPWMLDFRGIVPGLFVVSAELYVLGGLSWLCWALEIRLLRACPSYVSDRLGELIVGALTRRGASQYDVLRCWGWVQIGVDSVLGLWVIGWGRMWLLVSVEAISARGLGSRCRRLCSRTMTGELVSFVGKQLLVGVRWSLDGFGMRERAAHPMSAESFGRDSGLEGLWSLRHGAAGFVGGVSEAGRHCVTAVGGGLEGSGGGALDLRVACCSGGRRALCGDRGGARRRYPGGPSVGVGWGLGARRVVLPERERALVVVADVGAWVESGVWSWKRGGLVRVGGACGRGAARGTGGRCTGLGLGGGRFVEGIGLWGVQAGGERGVDARWRASRAVRVGQTTVLLWVGGLVRWWGRRAWHLGGWRGWWWREENAHKWAILVLVILRLNTENGSSRNLAAAVWWHYRTIRALLCGSREEIFLRSDPVHYD
ncbi:hypothetical protein Tco_0838444 [Tanacetum coccineum]|uniref:Uncharacterized protein n=1 Tax=Tanacetum coccineum TaxID=301880 RepID=A0ABQ5AQP8_9ASTR